MSNTVEAQRQKILEALKRGPLSSIRAIEELDILRPAARVHELRNKGFEIHTHWSVDHINGKPHKVAQYVMLS